MRYTVRDTPSTVRRIERDLATVLATLRQADPGLRSLVLTGGFARGEGAVRKGMPQNDYDLVAVRNPLQRTEVPYETLQDELSRQLGLHADLAPVALWRLRWASPSIFWYETALRGRVLWGDDVLDRIRIRSPDRLHPSEGLRLLVNRSAGLLLATAEQRPDGFRLQAAKALLAAMDVHLLALGAFAPSQTERWAVYQNLLANGGLTRTAAEHASWFAWAYQHKVDPDHAPRKDPKEAWRAARSAVLAAVPTALVHAGLRSLEAYSRRDGLADHVVYYKRAAQVPGARRLTLHPTSRVRVATLRLLEASPDCSVPAQAQELLQGLATGQENPVRRLDALRRATLQ